MTLHDVFGHCLSCVNPSTILSSYLSGKQEFTLVTSILVKFVSLRFLQFVEKCLSMFMFNFFKGSTVYCRAVSLLLSLSFVVLLCLTSLCVK